MNQLLLVLLCFVAALVKMAPAAAAPTLTVTTNPDGSTTYRIDQPTVTQAMTAYPSVVLHQGDLIHVAAGGCVQTGGRGKTWKRFADPVGDNSERLYSGTLQITGAMPTPSGRIANWINVPIAITATAATFSVGYQDDHLGDNGYNDPDPGNDNQCVGQGNAWVTVTVAEEAAPEPGDPRYNEVAMKSAHNAYQRDESLPDMLGYHHLRSVEIDIHDSNESAGWAELDRDWYVYHEVRESGSTCRKLSDCLHLLRAYAQAVPNHEIITILIDLKDAFRPQQQQSAEDFEAAILEGLGASRNDFLTPAIVAAPCLRLPIGPRRDCGWPRLSKLQGKWAIVLTTNKSLPSYLNCSNPTVSGAACAIRRLAFVAPELCADNAGQSEPCSDQEINAHPEARIFNLDGGDASRLAYGPVLRLKGFVARAYGLTPGNASWPLALANGIEIPSTDEVNASPPTTMITANPQGWPFTCLHEDCSGRPGDQPTLGLRVVSGDIWGGRDDFAFAEAKRSPVSMETRLFVPGSSVEEWAKSCLMARAAASPTAAYVALCRSADLHAPFIQFRIADGANTSRAEVDPDAFLPGFDGSRESITALRLSASADGKCFTGEASPDGVLWEPVGTRVCFAMPLAHRGLAASSHGNTAVSFAHVGLKLDGANATTAAFNSLEWIGHVQFAAIADGPL